MPVMARTCAAVAIGLVASVGRKTSTWSPTRTNVRALGSAGRTGTPSLPGGGARVEEAGDGVPGVVQVSVMETAGVDGVAGEVIVFGLRVLGGVL